MSDDSSLASSNSGKSANNNAFHRECKAAYLMVKISTSNDLLSVDEFVQAMQHAGRNPTRRTVKKFWPTDTGRMNFQQFCDILKQQPEMTDLELKKAFRKIDHNQNGFITFEELKILRQTDESLTDDDLQNIFSGADKNGDGKIDYNEFVKMVQQTAEETKKLALKKLEKLERKQLKAKKQHRRERTKEHQNSTEKVSKKENGILLKKQPTSSAKKFQESNDMQKWNKLKLKGCFIYDDEPSFPTLLSHVYQLNVARSTQAFIRIHQHATTASSAIVGTKKPIISYFPFQIFIRKVSVDQKSFNDDVMLFVTQSTGQVVAFTDNRSRDSWQCCQCSLKSGNYFVIPFTTGCKFQPIKLDTTRKRAKLLEEGKEGKLKLTKQMKLALMNIFDLCDLDDSGTLNREEFNIYNIRTGDEHVTDAEWDVVTTNFDTKNRQLTIKGFVDLHQMEAEDSGGDTDDMWVSLLAMGFNHNLQMEQALPFAIEIYHTGDPNDVTMHPTEIQTLSSELLNQIYYYFDANSNDYVIGENRLRIYQNNYMAAVLLKNEVSSGRKYKISLNEPTNVSLSNGATRFDVHLNSNETKVIEIIATYILPTEDDKEWIIESAKVETT